MAHNNSSKVTSASRKSEAFIEDFSKKVNSTRRNIDSLFNDCTLKFIKEKEKIEALASETPSPELESIKENFDIQKLELSNYEKAIKDELRSLFSTKNEYNLKLLANKTQTEAEIFKNFFPAYGVRKIVLDFIEHNSVLVLSSNYAYGFNVALPLLLLNQCRDRSVISCESSKTLSLVLRGKLGGFLLNDQIMDQNVSVFWEDSLLEKFSSLVSPDSSASYYIVYNVPIRRSIATDVLLAKLRDFLSQNPKSRLVLLLCKEKKVDKFVQYFSSRCSCDHLSVPNVSYPVKTIWKDADVQKLEDCIKFVVDTVISINALNPPGDIIAFLPSDTDVQSAVEKLDALMQQHWCHDLVVLCSNGKIVKTNSNRSEKVCRKAYLVSSSEDGLIIENVKYIVDCGLHRAQIFNSKKEISEVVPCFISKARAQARKEIAGVKSDGICYRTYSRENYKTMLPYELPELFCLNPILSLLRILMQYSPSSEFIQFVESLPLDVQAKTFATLTEYNAIQKFKVTPMGFEIMKLPYHPKYSRFFGFSLDWGLVYEAVVLVAFFLCESPIFVEPENDAHHRRIMEVKMEFYQEEGDTFSYLNIFRAWEENQFKKKWCEARYLNYEALEKVRDVAKRISFKLDEHYHITTDKQLKKDLDPSCLLKLLFISFSHSLCVFSGHEQIGFEILALKQHALVHPSSFVNQKQLPLFIIYDKLVEDTNNDFLCHLTCIPRDVIAEFQDTLRYSASELFSNKLDSHTFECVGENIFSKVLLKDGGSKVKELENQIKQDLNVGILLIEPILKKGCVKVYTQPSDKEKCVSALCKIFEKESSSLINEEETNIIELKKGVNTCSVRIKWVKGAAIVSFEHVFEQNEDRSVILRELKNDPDLKKPSAINYSLILLWTRRKCTGKGSVLFTNSQDFYRARRFANNYIKVSNKDVFIDYIPSMRNQLPLSDLPPDVTEEDIALAFQSVLPDCKFDVQLAYQPPFETTEEELNKIQVHIEDNCKNFTNLQVPKYEVKVFKPKPEDQNMRAIINVYELRDLEIEASNLSNAKIDDMVVTVEALYSSNNKCRIEVYDKLKFRLKEELNKFDQQEMPKHPGKLYKIDRYVDKSGEDMNITLSANDIDVMEALQRLVQNILEGMKLSKSSLPSIQKLFCHGGYLFLTNLERTENVCILQNSSAQVIRLYGMQENCNTVARAIYEFLDDSENETALTVDLTLVNNGRAMLKQIIKQYGIYLEKFIESSGLRAAALDLKRCCIMLNGKKSSVEKAENCLKEISAKLNPNVEFPDLISQDTCVLCVDFADNLMYRLELCCHIYCSVCIQGLINTAEFPLKCAAPNCNAHVLLNDVKKVLENDDVKIKELASKSLKSYLENNKKDIFFCPAPDCPMFYYKSGISENRFQCSLCSSFLCISCQVVYHEGLSCEMYKESQLDPDYQLRRLIKRCPGCKVRVEKSEGCNRVCCNLCRTPFCWICMASFDTIPETYDHIDLAHPGQLEADVD